MARLTLKLLGAMQVTLDGRVVGSIETEKARLLLAYLAFENARPHPRAALAQLLWPDKPEGRARRNLSQALYNLRLALGDRSPTGTLAPEESYKGSEPYLLVTPHSLQFNPKTDHSLDTARFRQLLAGCGDHQPTAHSSCQDCMERFREATGLYQGEFLADLYLKDCLAFEEWMIITREHLRQQVLHALECLTDFHERRGELEQAIDCASRQVELDPFGENARRSLMRLLTQDGQRSAALVQYESLKRLLGAELRAEPERKTNLLYQRLRLESDAAVPLDLPEALTPFIGRRTELLELGGMLRDPACRLLSVLGPGGSGKTRLALEAARKSRLHFPHGLYLVQLSGLTSLESFLPALAESLGLSLRESADPETQISSYLRDKTALLILDSFETVLDAAPLVAELLRAAPTSKVLVTTRASLNLKAEQGFPLGGMDYPSSDQAYDPQDFSAVALFLSAAHREHPRFQPSAADLTHIARICELVEGMPLGVLLASAWVDQYSPSEIARRIEGGLDFLSVDWGDIPERQRSLRATFDYSWDLLTEQERSALAGMSVFRGGFTRRAAREVAGASPHKQRALVAKSMLGMITEGRCQMHDLVRQFAAERLAQEPDIEKEIRERHCTHYFGRLQEWGVELEGPRQESALAEMDEEVNNLQAAWNWVVSQEDIERLYTGLEILGQYYRLRSRHAEACLHIEQGLELITQLPDTPENRLRHLDTLISYAASGWRVYVKSTQVHLAEAEQLIAELPELDEEHLARFLFYKSRLLFSKNEMREAIACCHQVLPMAKKLGDTEILAVASSAIGQLLSTQRLPAKAEPLLRKAIPLFEEMGDWVEWGRASGYHGWQISLMGECTAGIEEIHTGLAKVQELGYLSEVSLLYLLLGHARMSASDYPGSIQAFNQAVDLALKLSILAYVFVGNMYRGWCETRFGHIEAASASLDQAKEILQELGGVVIFMDAFVAIRAKLALRQGRVQEALDLCQQAGEMAKGTGSVETAGLAQRVWGEALAKMDPPRWEQAEEHLADSLRLFEEAQAWLEVAHTHVTWGEVCHARGDLKAARAHLEVAAAQWEASECTDALERTRALMDELE